MTNNPENEATNVLEAEVDRYQFEADYKRLVVKYGYPEVLSWIKAKEIE